jgi:hypothetical protein
VPLRFVSRNVMTSGQYTIATDCDTEVHYHAAGLSCLCRKLLFVFRKIVRNSAFEIYGVGYLAHYLHLEQPFMHTPRHGYCMVKILQHFAMTDWTPSTLQDWQKPGVLQVLLAGNRQLEKTLRWLHCVLAAFLFFFFMIKSFKRPRWSVGHGKML